MRRIPSGATILAAFAGLAALQGARGADKDAARIALRLPADLVFNSASDAPGVVVFRHASHVAIARGSCVTCHPRPFRILHPARRTSHAEMDAGGSCGACHDGKAAFSIAHPDSCEFCHTGPAAEARPVETHWPEILPSPVLRRNPDSPGPVTFRHGAHLAVEARCSPCHPALFRMKAGTTRLAKDAMLGGAACGACHDGKRAFGVDDERCERCHGETQ